MKLRFYFLLFTLFLSSITSSHIKFTEIFVECGSNIGSRVRDQILGYLREIPDVKVGELPNSSAARNSESLILLLGNTSATHQLIHEDNMQQLPPVGNYYIVFF